MDLTREPSLSERPGWRSDFSDGDLTFFMLVHRDHRLADESLRRLRRHYPGARVIVRSDGDPDPRHELFAKRYEVEYLCERRMFPVANGGRIVQRMLDLFLDDPTSYLFKIDPDTALRRRFDRLPATDAMFGTIQGAPEYRSVQGGCMGFTMDAALAMARSRLLSTPELERPQPLRGRSHWCKLTRRAERAGLASFDWSLGWLAAELQVPLLEAPEIQSFSRGRARARGPSAKPERAGPAVTHPVQLQAR